MPTFHFIIHLTNLKFQHLKILLIRFSSIGDIVLTTPIIRCLKKQMPAGTEIHYLTKPSFEALLNKNPNIDKLWLLKNKESETIAQLRSENFNRIIDLHKNLRTLRIKFSLGVKSYSFNKLNFKKFLLTQYKVNKLPAIHIVDRYFEAVKELKIINDGEGLDYFDPEIPVDLSASFMHDQPFLAMAIGGQHFTKRMPEQKLKEIISGLQTKIVLIGGKEDLGVADLLEKEFPAKVLNLVGKLSLHQSAGVVKMSKALITHDTGMMHIAAALKRKILVIWGNTVPEFGMYPYYGNQPIPYYNFEVQGLSCRPCSKIGYKVCPKGHFKCMNLQNVNEIIKATE